MKTNFYVDGFNLYYGSLKHTPYKWLDLWRFFQLSFPDDEIHRIRYFTAVVSPPPNNRRQAERQLVYHRALRTLPMTEIHRGHFLVRRVDLPLASPEPGGPGTARVVRVDEKGSDVNLACHLLFDAFDGDFDKAVVVTNDSDLVTPVRMVRERFGKPVVVLTPGRRLGKPNSELGRVATATPRIYDDILAAAQFPPEMTDAKGPFHKPPTW